MPSGVLAAGLAIPTSSRPAATLATSGGAEMQDDKGDVVDLGERRHEKRAAERHPIHAEIHDLIDQILDRAEIYEKAGRPDEAERLLAGLKHARAAADEIPQEGRRRGELMVHHRDAGRPRRRKIVGIVGIIATLCFIVGAFVVVDMRTKSYWTEHECEDHGVCPPAETPGKES